MVVASIKYVYKVEMEMSLAHYSLHSRHSMTYSQLPPVSAQMSFIRSSLALQQSSNPGSLSPLPCSIFPEPLPPDMYFVSH